MMHVSVMDIEMFRGESSTTSNAQARHEGDVIACFRSVSGMTVMEDD